MTAKTQTVYDVLDELKSTATSGRDLARRDLPERGLR